MQDQDALGRCVVQPRPSQLDFFQLPQNILAEGFRTMNVVAGVGRVRSELAVQLPPGRSAPERVSEKVR